MRAPPRRRRRAALTPHRLFTWNTKDLCLVFRWWHVSSTSSLVFSLLAVVALGMGYEFLRELARRHSARIAAPGKRPAPPPAPLPPRSKRRTRHRHGCRRFC